MCVFQKKTFNGISTLTYRESRTYHGSSKASSEIDKFMMKIKIISLVTFSHTTFEKLSCTCDNTSNQLRALDFLYTINTRV